MTNTIAFTTQRTQHRPPKIVILISGRGSNMKSLVQWASQQGVQVQAVIANKANALGVAWAQQQGLPTHVIEHAHYPDRHAFDEALKNCIDGYEPDLVVLAGFMRILTPEFVQHYLGRLVNIHPSILPSFVGLHTHERALQSTCTVHGCTVHYVVPELDAGPIIAQGIVPVLTNDTPDTLASRVLEIEHPTYIQAVDYVLKGLCHLDADLQIVWQGQPQRLFLHPLFHSLSL